MIYNNVIYRFTKHLWKAIVNNYRRLFVVIFLFFFFLFNPKKNREYVGTNINGIVNDSRDYLRVFWSEPFGGVGKSS